MVVGLMKEVLQRIQRAIYSDIKESSQELYKTFDGAKKDPEVPDHMIGTKVSERIPPDQKKLEYTSFNSLRFMVKGRW